MSKGIVTFYINRHEFKTQEEPVELVNLFKNINKEVLTKIEAEGFHVMFMPTTNESSRIEKIEFAQPIPDNFNPNNMRK